MHLHRRPRRFAPTLLLASLATTAVAQTRFDLYATSHLPCLAPTTNLVVEANDFATGDFDGDGDLDVAVADNRAGLFVWRNGGDGTFSPWPQTQGITRSSVVTAFDADGDGDLDLLVAGGGTAYGSPGPCRLLRNDGAGNFTAYGSLPAIAISPYGVQAGDLDDDGDQDIMVQGGTPLYLRNDGGGVFADATMSLPQGAAGGQLRYFDGDGTLDIANGNTVFLNNGNGTFSSVALPVFGDLFDDLDGDGDTDYLGGNPYRAYLNNGTGQVFTAVGSVPTPQSLLLWRNVRRAIDLDGDGYREILQLDAHARPMVLRHSGNFAFTVATATFCDAQPATAVDYVWGASTWFDADGDGDLDWLTGGTEGRSTSSTTVGIPPKLYLAAGLPGGPRLVEATRPRFPRLQWPGAPAAAGDVDGDGDIDLIADGLWLQNANGSYVPGPALPPPAAFFPAYGPGLLTDLDGDGDLDLFLTDGPGRGMIGTATMPRLCRNNGGTFVGVAVPSTVTTVGTACAAGDVDGDGDVDIVLGSHTDAFGGPGPRVVLLRNDGNLQFTDAAAQMPSLSFETGDLALRDFDFDGDLDLILGTEESYHSTPSIRFFANDGTGNFTDQTAARLPAIPDGFGLAVADLDGDGDLDFAQQRLGNPVGYVFTNDGSGVFTVLPGTHGTHVVDWRGDGTLVDLWDNVHDGFAIDGTNVSWTFAWVGSIPTVLLPFDYDQDGDLDLAVGGLPLFGSANYSMFQQGLVVNLHRDLRLASMPRLGQPLRLQARAANDGHATYACVATTTGLLPQRIPVPVLGRGSLAVDLNLLLALDLLFLPDADTVAEVARQIPSSPVFLGVQIAAQALFLPTGNQANAHFSNVVTTTVLFGS